MILICSNKVAGFVIETSKLRSFCLRSVQFVHVIPNECIKLCGDLAIAESFLIDCWGIPRAPESAYTFFLSNQWQILNY